jgi:pentatricopeptide repeat protein
MGFRKTYHIALVVLIAVLSACGGGKALSGELDPGKEGILFQRKFFEAQSEKAIGNLDKAYALFGECSAISPDNDAVAYEMAQLDVHFGNFESARMLAEKAVSLDEENEWYRLLMARIYVDAGEFDEAAEQFAKAIEINSDQLDAYFDLAHAQLLTGDAKGAIKTYNALERKVGINPDLSVGKHEIYMELGDAEAAENELVILAEEFPADMNIQSVLAQFYLRQGRTEEAMQVYSRMEDLDSENGVLQMQLSEYYATQGDDEKSYAALVRAFESSDVPIDQKVNILLRYYSLTEIDRSWLDKAYELLEITERVHPNEAKASAMYGDFLLRDSQIEEARDKYRKAVSLDQTRNVIWTQLLILEAELNDFTALQEESREALELFPTMPIFYLYNGIAGQQLEDYEEAINSLNLGKEFVIEDNGMLAQFYSTLGDTYHIMGEHQASDKAYDQTLELEPNNVFVLNNYAYYLSLRGLKLAKAAKMAELANSLDPGNASFEDTLGWVYFKSEDYVAAIEWLSKAETHGGSNSPEVLEHLGDAYFQNGDAEKAIEYWNRAKSAGGDSELLMKKIQDGQWYEG